MCPKPYPKSLTCHSSPVFDLSESNSTDPAWSDAPLCPDVDPGVTSRDGNTPNWNVTSGFVRPMTPQMLGSPVEAESLARAFRDFLPFAVTTGSSSVTPTVKGGSRGSREGFDILSSATPTTSSGLGTNTFVLSSVACGRMRPKISCWFDGLVDKAAPTSR